MNEFVEKLIERLEEEKWIRPTTSQELSVNYALEDAISIVKELAEEYNNGWIPCSEGLPKNYEIVNITWVNRNPVSYYEDIKDKPFTATAIYFYGKWYWFSCVCEDYLKEYGDSEVDRMDKDIEVIAWKPLPAIYKPKESRNMK